MGGEIMEKIESNQLDNAGPRRQMRPTDFASLLAARPAMKAQGFWHHEIAFHWPEIVGAVFARHSQPRRLQFPQGQRTGGTLTVAATGAVALLMQHQVMPILDRINTYFGYHAVAAIRFQQVDAGYLTRLTERPAPSQQAARPLPQ
jgi:hypothetical protein